MQKKWNAPTHLTHKPIIVVNDYDTKDGMFAGNTDAKALSIGRAQYNETEIAAKIFRHTGSMWSRQSEEMPIHRTLDLTILILASMADRTAENSITSLEENIVSPEQFQEITRYYEKNKEVLQPRLLEMKKLLDTILK